MPCCWYQRCSHIKLWRIIKVQSAFNIICILFSCGATVNWRMTMQMVHLISSLAHFSLVARYCVFLWKICRWSRNYSNFIYIFLNFKLRTEKYICLLWVFFSGMDSRMLRGLSDGNLQYFGNFNSYWFC